MKATELLKEFPEKSFSEIWEEQLKYIKSIHNQIDDKQVENFKNDISKIFHLDSLVYNFKIFIQENLEINIEERDYISIKENGLEIIKTLNNYLKNPNYFDLNKKDLFQIFEKFTSTLQYNPNNNRYSFLSDEYIYTPRGQITTGKKIIDVFIEKLEDKIRVIKLESKYKIISKKYDLEVLNDFLKKSENFTKDFSEIESKIKSIKNFEKEITKEEIKNIGDFFNKQGRNIENKNEKIYKWFIKWKNTDWIWLAIIFSFGIFGVSIFNVIEEGKLLLTTIPLIATFTLFIIFFLKQYSNNKNLINSYYFKGISADVMERLLITRNGSEEGKIILEKTLDKILEEPGKSEKGGNETINLINTSLKTPGS